MKHCLSERVDRKIPVLRVLFGCQLVFIFLCLSINPAIAQERTVTGTVQSGNNPVPGVSVQVKGHATGTQTDANGKFSIAAPVNSILIFSSVGFERREVKAGSAADLSIDLVASSGESLNDVIVVGYGTQKKSDVTGAVASVDLKSVGKTPANRVDDAIQGRVAGVVIQHNDASPDAQLTIRIRGANSINGANDPLVVIDGLQGANLSTLAPEDVESIEILKDASATAIYGSRGANGVVIVTTKKGRKGKSVISFDALNSMTSVRKKLDLMNSYQYAQTVNDYRSDQSPALLPAFSAAQLAKFQGGYGTNWQDQIFRHGDNQNYSVGISGGSDNTTFYLNGNVLDNKGIVLNTDYKRYSLRANVTTKINDHFSAGVNVFLSKEENHPTPLNGFSNGSPIFSAQLFAPTLPLYDSTGKYSTPNEAAGYGPPTNYNPVALAVTPIKNYITNSDNILAYLEYTVIQGLKINISGGYQLSDVTNNDYENALPTGLAGATTANANIFSSHFITYQNTNQVTYEKKIGNHSLKFTGVVEQQYQQYNSVNAGAIGFLTDALSYNDLGLGASPQIPASTANTRSLMSYMGRINYGYKDLYLLTLTERADGSSVFGANNKWGYFPSAAVGWNLINEHFIKDLDLGLTNLKLRGSYGITGNQAISPYQSLASLNTGLPYDINGSSLAVGVGLGSLQNPNLKWEKTAQTDIGLDLSLLNGRLDLSADYYNKKTSDLLLAVPTPIDQGGKGSIVQNVGSVSNKGYELYLGGRPVVSGGFTWESGFTFGVNRNKVLSLINGVDSIPLPNGVGLPNFGVTQWLQVGQPLGLFKGLVYQGVWKTAEAAQAAALGFYPGAPKYADVNHDSKINGNDIVTIGNAQPKFSFGWTNTFSYKNFDLNVFIQGVQGNQIYDLGRVRSETTTIDASATSTRILNRWSPTNENTDVPSFQGSKLENLQSSRWLEDGSYVRLKNISLGYTLPSGLCTRLGIQALRFYVSGTNLVTWTKYSGFDPEASSAYSINGGSNGLDQYSGVDLATYPAQKSFTIGLNLKF